MKVNLKGYQFYKYNEVLYHIPGFDEAEVQDLTFTLDENQYKIYYSGLVVYEGTEDAGVYTEYNDQGNKEGEINLTKSSQIPSLDNYIEIAINKPYPVAKQGQNYVESSVTSDNSKTISDVSLTYSTNEQSGITLNTDENCKLENGTLTLSADVIDTAIAAGGYRIHVYIN